MHAVLQGKIKAVKYLIKRGADMTIPEKDGCVHLSDLDRRQRFRTSNLGRLRTIILRVVVIVVCACARVCVCVCVCV